MFLRLILKGLLLLMVIVFVGVRCFFVKRWRRVVLFVLLVLIKRVWDLGGRERVMFERLVEWFWKR